MKYFLYRITLISFLLTTSACTQVAFTAINLPSRFDDMEVAHDLSYGPEPSQKLDIYMPADAQDKNLDVIVFFYGGRWTYGDKDYYRFVGKTFTDKNFIVVVPDHRNIPRCAFQFLSRMGRKRCLGL